MDNKRIEKLVGDLKSLSDHYLKLASGIEDVIPIGNPVYQMGYERGIATAYGIASAALKSMLREGINE